MVRLTYATIIFSVFSFKCKDWGFLLKKQFGSHLGTGDYGHLVVDCSAMLLQHFHSFYKYSGQGFESSHKLHHQLYSKATNHDASEPGQSCELINICFDAYTIMKNAHINEHLIWMAVEPIKISPFSFQWIKSSLTGMQLWYSFYEVRNCISVGGYSF